MIVNKSIRRRMPQRSVGWLAIVLFAAAGAIHSWMVATHHPFIAGFVFGFAALGAFFLGRFYQATLTIAWFEADSTKAMRDMSSNTDESIQKFCDEVAEALEKSN